MGRTAATSSALAVLAACGGHNAAPTSAPAPAKRAPPPPSFATVSGDWTLDELGGPVTVPTGIGVFGDRVAMVYAGPDIAPAVASFDGTAWKTQWIDLGDRRGMVGAVAPPVLLFDTMDPLATTQWIEYVRDGRPETIAAGCPIGVPEVQLLDADTVLYGCGDEHAIVRRTAKGWTKLADVPDVALTGAVGADGTVYLLSRMIVPPAPFWTVHDGKLAKATLDGVDGCWSFARCGDRLYASCERAAGSAFGTFDGTRWRFETVTSEYVNAGVLGFDEACHPFVAVNQDVWSRGAHGWVKSMVAGADEVVGLVGHGGTLYAAYQVTTDSIHAGVATAPLGYDGP